MRLISLKANKSTFHTVNFHPSGVTLVVARQNNPGASDRGKTYNGVGKSLLLYLVHFCLGAKENQALQDSLPGWEFTLRYELDGDSYEAVRKTDDQRKIEVNGKDLTLPKFNEELLEQVFGLRRREAKNLTLRTLVSRFMRPRRESYVSYDRCDSHEAGYALLAPNAYLLGLDIGLVKRKQELKVDQDKQEADLRSLDNNPLFRQYFGADKNVEIQIKYLQNLIEGLTQQKDQFQVAENYHQVELRANEVRERLQKARNQHVLINNALDRIKESARQRPDIPAQKVFDLFAEAEISLPEALVRNVDDVLAFHQQLMSNRIARLNRERDRLFSERQQVEEEIHTLSNEMDSLLQFLNAHRALDEYVSLTQRLADLQGKLAQLQQQRSLHEELQKEVRRIERSQLDEIDRANEYLAREREWIDDLLNIFNGFARQFYPDKPSGLVIENNTGEDNGIRFNIKADIQDDPSDGIGHIKIFCYDMTLMRAALASGLKHHSRNNMRCLFHDSRIFDGVDPRQAATLMEIAEEETRANGTQYIATINENTLEAIGSVWGKDRLDAFVEQTRTLDLTDESADSKLLGVQVDLHYDS